MRPLFLYASLLGLLVFSCPACKKHESQPQDSAKTITAFVFKASDNPGLKTDVAGQIGTDTIHLGLPDGTALSNLVPSVSFNGKTISPSSGTAQNFSVPVRYIVTATDASSKTYIVVARDLSGAKAITSFVFKAADNPGLTADLTGTISNDTIRVSPDPGLALNHLVPRIVFTGQHLNYDSGVPEDFSGPFQYVVFAEDGSTKSYSVFAGADQMVYFGSSDSYIYALDAMTGAVKWKMATGGPVSSTPTVANGVVYIGSDDGYLYALDAQTGAQKWRVGGLHNPFRSTLTVANGLIYFDGQNGGISLTALDTASGQIRWWNPGGNIVSEAPTVVGSTLYFTCYACGGVSALDALTGAQKWNSSVVQEYIYNPAVSEGTLYVSQGYYIMAALDATTGVQKWFYRDSSFLLNGNVSFLMGSCPPSVSNGLVYVGGASGYLYALDAATGHLVWKQPSRGQIYYDQSIGLFTGAVVSGGTVFSGASDSYVYAFDAGTGQSKWTYGSVIGRYLPYVAVGNNGVYATCSDGVHLLDSRTGTPKWTFPGSGMIFSAPCITDTKGQVFHPAISGDQN